MNNKEICNKSEVSCIQRCMGEHEDGYKAGYTRGLIESEEKIEIAITELNRLKDIVSHEDFVIIEETIKKIKNEN